MFQLNTNAQVSYQGTCNLRGAAFGRYKLTGPHNPPQAQQAGGEEPHAQATQDDTPGRTYTPPPGQRVRGLMNRNYNGHSQQKRRMTRAATINVSTLREKEEEIIELMKVQKLEILGMCETRLRGNGEKILHDNYKLIYSGEEDGRHGVAFMVAPNTAERVDSIRRRGGRQINTSLKFTNYSISLIQVYAPQTGRPLEVKERFYEELQEMVDEAKHREIIIVMGDWNGHVGRERDGYEGVVGAQSIGDRNDDGRRILDFCLVNNAAIMNTFYEQQELHKWTWYGWNLEELRYTRRSMIDLFITNKKNLFKDVKAIPSVSPTSGG